MSDSIAEASLRESISRGGSLKQEGKSNRLKHLEDETKALRSEVTNCISIITSQTAQLARQEKLLNELQEERRRRDSNREITWMITGAVLVCILVYFILNGFPTMIGEDAPLYLNLKVTPTNAPFVTVGVRAAFTMRELLSCLKGAFSGDTISLSIA